MRNHLSFWVNGEAQEIVGEEALCTLSDFLRGRLRKTGTKVVCAEGDCGACSVLVGRPIVGVDAVGPEAVGPEAEPGVRYGAVDSCIVSLAQLDATHIVTVEGLAAAGVLHPVQEAMVRHFGSQCGFCTPGFVVALAGWCENERESATPQVATAGPAGALAGKAREQIELERARRELCGNLCRCTGYVQILEAAQALTTTVVPPIGQLFDLPRLARTLCELEKQEVRVDAGRIEVSIPATLDSALKLRAARPGARVLAGGTDLGVQRNKGKVDLRDVLVLSARLDGLVGVKVVPPTAGAEGELELGAGCTWSEVEEAVRGIVSLEPFHRVLELFGAPQIRRAGTVGGNLVNASPIADSLPFLYVMDAELELRSTSGARRIPIERFYRGYKELDLGPDELLARVRCRLPGERDALALYKISRRRDLDISSLGFAAWLRFEGTAIAELRIAVGGAGPTVLRLREAEECLVGVRLDDPAGAALFATAGKLARAAIAPISDVRGAADYRRSLVERALHRLWSELQATRGGRVLASTSSVDLSALWAGGIGPAPTMPPAEGLGL